MADSTTYTNLHPRVQRFVKMFYALLVMMWVGLVISDITYQHTASIVFAVLFYVQLLMVTYGNINRSIRIRRRRKREADSFFNYQVQLQLARRQQQMQQIQQQVYYEAMKKLELARKQQETYSRAKVLLQQQLYQQQQYQQQRWSIASDQYVDAIRELKDLT